MKDKKSFLIVVIILFFVALLVSFSLVNHYKEKKVIEEQEKIELEEKNKKEKIEEINSHYAEVVVTNCDAKLYEYKNDKYSVVGTVSKDELLNLSSVDINDSTEYFHIEDLDLFIKYKEVNPYDGVKEIDSRYQKYVPFNENIISNDSLKLYRDEKLIYTLNYSIDEEIIIKDDNGYYVEYFNELFFVKKEDISKTYNKNNTNAIVANEVPVTVYHFIYLNGDNSCNESICHSENQIRDHFGYLKDNSYFTMNTTEVRLFLEGKIRIPEKSILVTIDDGARAEKFVPLLEEYGINATLFLITSWYPVDKFKSNYLEIASHTDNLHSPGVCNGGQGSPLKCLDKNELVNDLKLSREKLNGTEAFCYPFYEYNNHAIEAVKEAGFKIGFIGEQKKAKVGVDLYKVPRITIHDGTSLNQYINYIK